MLRGTITGLCLLSITLLSGCSYFDSLSGLFSNAEFAAKPVRAIAPPYDFHVGDIYRYRVGDLFSEEKVTHVTGQDVSWADNYGRTWVTDAGTLLPPKEFHAGGTTPKSTRASMETTGPLYPLLIGKSVAFRFSRTGGGAPTSQHTQDCTVDDYGGVITKSGPYDVYKLTCRYDGVPYVNYFAPKIGRVVLQTGGSIFASVERELVSYQSGGAADTRMAAARPTAKPAAKLMGQMNAKPAAPPKSQSSKPLSTKPLKAMAANSENANGFGIQLAAYKSRKRARDAWKRIKRRGGNLLSHMTPAIERHAGDSGVIYRLIVGKFKSKAKAATRCKALKRKRIDCWARPSARKQNPGHSANDSSPLQAPKAKRRQHARGAQRQNSGRQSPDQAVAVAPPARLYYTKP